MSTEKTSGEMVEEQEQECEGENMKEDHCSQLRCSSNLPDRLSLLNLLMLFSAALDCEVKL